MTIDPNDEIYDEDFTFEDLHGYDYDDDEPKLNHFCDEDDDLIEIGYRGLSERSLREVGMSYRDFYAN